MRTLLVDNYDSFTYNLFHYLAEVNGQHPQVIRNDDPTWHPESLDGFDNVVLSPGPGSPHRPADFGLCAAIAAEGRLPVLGVCLGHQGIGLAHGAQVNRAPEPRHGRTSLIRHDGADLFEGLPSPLEVVRYHSLAVSGITGALAATAWTDDDIVMALQHRTLPLWGVQFHPESIGTVGGHRLLANFAKLTERHRPLRTVVQLSAPTPPAVAVVAERVRRLEVLVEAMDTRWDAEVAFDHLIRADDHPFWLDSSQNGGPGEVSVMGNAAGPLARIATADVTAGTVTVTSRDGVEVQSGEFFEWLDNDMRSLDTKVPFLPFEFALGWVGALGYELKAECEGDSAHPSREPDAIMVFADRAVVLDHRTRCTYLLALAEGGDDGDARAWLSGTTAALKALTGREPRPCDAPPVAETSELRLRYDRAGYLGLISKCQEEIRSGETYEVCLTNMIEADTDIDPWQAYRFLRRFSPAPFAAFLGFGDVSVLSTSPERFLQIDRHGEMESKPIKGTRPRGRTPEEDVLLVDDLSASEKDRAENLMIVDLVRHDLGRCAEVGSVHADKVFDVESYATVHQLVSTVRAQLAAGCSPVTGVRCAFPGGSMIGAPKIRTMRIIDRLEAGPRGLYSGAIGYFSLTGATDLSIVIRTVVLHNGRLRYGVGGAIIALSDAATEYEETAVKARPVLTLLGAEFPERETAPLFTQA